MTRVGQEFFSVGIIYKVASVLIIVSNVGKICLKGQLREELFVTKSCAKQLSNVQTAPTALASTRVASSYMYIYVYSYS